MNPANSPDTTISSQVPPSPSIQPLPPILPPAQENPYSSIPAATTEPQSPRLDSLIRPSEGETKPTSKMVEAAMELSRVTANDKEMHDIALNNFKTVSEEYLKSLLPKSSQPTEAKTASDPQI